MEDGFWIPAGVYPVLEYGAGMALFLVNHGLLNRSPPLLTAASKLDGGGEGWEVKPIEPALQPRL